MAETNNNKSPIAPLQIRKQSFKQVTFGGYRKEDVSEYLSDVAENMSSVSHRNEELERQVGYLHTELAKLKEIERTLLESLSQSQEANRLNWEQAQKRADLLILEGKMQADALLQNAKSSAKNILLSTQQLADQTLTEMKREIKLLNYSYEYSAQQKAQMMQELQSFMETALSKIERLSKLDVEHTSEHALERAEKMHQHHSQIIREQLQQLEGENYQELYNQSDSAYSDYSSPTNYDKETPRKVVPEIRQEVKYDAEQKTREEQDKIRQELEKTQQQQERIRREIEEKEQREKEDFAQKMKKKEELEAQQQKKKEEEAKKAPPANSRGLIFDLNDL
ncbi:DivIVA domain protein [Bernardetia litoralis DSM 6794]|uniref:DivIVA domain protein n=1 Tax=Bernardetia litoralis (strain ATCC 23117 / DSM 6794 / NBRC 15988 / NCIMB 1366 / Fx l1 / Sio-4) TaxID=880071 RepID=I4AI29_BERLS|nr:DivIVA domain-containing protein [Bernardetia litoralis]AFM03614.1 DivIVA domain protein [Bernardetia litoralis DSM 6794]